MRRALLPVTLSLAGLALIVWFVWGLFEAQRGDVAIARAFLTHVAAGETEAAAALMTPALAGVLGPRGLSDRFAQIEPWEHIGFSSRRSNRTGDMRRTDLIGTGTAISGCESALRMTLLGGQVDAFNVTPLCTAGDAET